MYPSSSLWLVMKQEMATARLTSGMFTVDAATGVVRTAVRQYKEGQMYRVLVQAIDKTPKDNSTKQVGWSFSDHKLLVEESEVAKLEILAGDRPPQFLQQHYTVSLAEDSLRNLLNFSVVDVRAHRFRAIDDRRSKGELTYSLYGYHGGQREETSVFGIDPKSGVIHLRRLLDYDDPSQTKLHKLIGKLLSVIFLVDFANLLVNSQNPQNLIDNQQSEKIVRL
ncbi:unnamed protein product [Strongylus vulgaris]|uniref:Cadherin domain-containing protein n=1 Tax=Strongylus vulgaris TaxID=40348 RepID=A0A3P7LKN2_STRVU|nr:unnamed protein product [Strongylus vulgaris]